MTRPRRASASHPSTGMLAIAGLVAAAIAAIPAGAADSDAGPTDSGVSETVEVNLVNIPVIVTDRRGEPVTGLDIEDFRVSEDGDRVELAFFTPQFGGPDAVDVTEGDASGPGSRWIGSAPTSDPSGSLRIVLIVDLLNLDPGRRVPVFRRIVEHLRAPEHADVPVMVAVHGQDLRIAQGFSTDRDRLGRVLDRVAQDNVAGWADSAAFDSQLRDLRGSVRNLQQCFSAPGCSPVDLTRATVSEIRAFSHFASAQIERQMNDLNQLFASLNHVPGNKVALFVSDGFPLDPGQSLTREVEELLVGYLNRLRAASGGGATGGGFGNIGGQQSSNPAQGLVRQIDQLLRSLSMENAGPGVSNSIESVAAIANTGGMRLYALQTTPHASGVAAAEISARDLNLGGTALASRTRDANFQAPLRIVSAATGGKMHRGPEQVGTLIDTIREDGSNHYVLSFYSRVATDGERHKIDVKLRKGARARAGKGKLQVRYPSSYLGRSLQMQRAERTLASLFHGFGENPHGVFVEVAERGEDERGRPTQRLWLQVPFDALTFVPDGTHQVAELFVFTASKDRRGRLTALQETPVPVRIPNDRVEEARAAPIPVRIEVPSRRGRNDVAVGLWTAGGEPSFTRTMFTRTKAARGDAPEDGASPDDSAPTREDGATAPES